MDYFSTGIMGIFAPALTEQKRPDVTAPAPATVPAPAVATPKVRDFWDKAPVITSALSSVALAIVGLYISSSFQRSQLAATNANNAAQLAISREKNQSDIRLQELKLASELMESLVSNDARRRKVATLMLPSALSDHEMTQQILSALTSDADSGVRVAAITKLGGATTIQAAVKLEEVHADTTRPEAERRLARDLATRVSLNSNLPQNTVSFRQSRVTRPDWD